jgi:hypothetical protein
MANTPIESRWTADGIRGAVRKIRRTLADVEAFDPHKVTRQRDPIIATLEISIREMLIDVFGPNSRSYRSYQTAASLDMAGLSVGSPTPLGRVISGLMEGKERSVALLNSAIQFFQRKMEDDFPGEPFDTVALSARTAIMTTGSADPRISRAGIAQAGAAIVGFLGEHATAQNDVPAGGVIIAESAGEAPDVAAFTGTVGNDETRYTELQARVTLLESSLDVLRQEIASQTPDRKIGPGHNRGPDFLPVPVEELDDIDQLIALLKESGPTPPADRAPLIEQDAKVIALGDRISTGLLTLGAEMSKGAARESGKELLAAHWTSVAHWIVSVSHTLLIWLGMG